MLPGLKQGRPLGGLCRQDSPSGEGLCYGESPPQTPHVLICATGFDALTGALLAIDIQGRGGRHLADTWAEEPITYLGLAIPGFPNLFTITGPGSPSVLVTMPTAIEQHVEWIEGCISWAANREIDQIEARHDAAMEWTAHVQEIANMTLFPKAGSWYMGANIPGKPRFFLPYIGGFDVYHDRCDEESTGGYTGFEVGSNRAASVDREAVALDR